MSRYTWKKMLNELLSIHFLIDFKKYLELAGQLSNFRKEDLHIFENLCEQIIYFH